MRGQRLHDVLERHVLVGEGREVGRADAAEQIPEGGVPRGVGAQDERVDEEADQCVETWIGPVGDRGGDRDVGSGAEAGEEYGERGVDDHEHARAFGGGEPGETSVRFGGDPEGDGGAVVRRRRGVVCGKGDAGRQAVQRADPVGEPAFPVGGRVFRGEGVRVAGEREVGVLTGQRWQPGGRSSAQPRGVGGFEIGCERGEGRVVAGDVVQKEQQCVRFARIGGEQLGPQRGFEVEAEGAPRAPGQQGGEFARGGGRLDEAGAAPLGRQDALMGPAVLLLDDGAQDFVPVGHVAQSGSEGGAVQ